MQQVPKQGVSWSYFTFCATIWLSVYLKSVFLIFPLTCTCRCVNDKVNLKFWHCNHWGNQIFSLVTKSSDLSPGCPLFIRLLYYFFFNFHTRQFMSGMNVEYQTIHLLPIFEFMHAAFQNGVLLVKIHCEINMLREQHFCKNFCLYCWKATHKK